MLPIKHQSCHHIETSQLICTANQLTGFYMMPTLAFNELILLYKIKLCQKKVVEKLSFNELKIEKVKFFRQSPTKIFCIHVFNVGGCLASCLTFRPFLMLDP